MQKKSVKLVDWSLVKNHEFCRSVKDKYHKFRQSVLGKYPKFNSSNDCREKLQNYFVRHRDKNKEFLPSVTKETKKSWHAAIGCRKKIMNFRDYRKPPTKFFDLSQKNVTQFVNQSRDLVIIWKSKILQKKVKIFGWEIPAYDILLSAISKF